MGAEWTDYFGCGAVDRGMTSKDPLHGVTLEQIVTQMVDRFGWDEMYDEIKINCFGFDPSVKSSLTFLRKTPWARAKLEAWYIDEFCDTKE